MEDYRSDSQKIMGTVSSLSSFTDSNLRPQYDGTCSLSQSVHRGRCHEAPCPVQVEVGPAMGCAGAVCGGVVALYV